jgi:hypothetical protein
MGDSLSVSKFHTRHDVVSFTEIGSREHPNVEGVIVEVPELIPDRFGDEGEQCMVLRIKDADGAIRTVYARRRLLSAIGDAVLDSGREDIAEGDRIAAWLKEERASARGPLKQKIYGVWVSREPIGVCEFVDANGKPVAVVDPENPWGADDLEAPPF